MVKVTDKQGKVWKFSSTGDALEFVRAQGDCSYDTYFNIMMGMEVKLK